jgi:hypothetical protein
MTYVFQKTGITSININALQMVLQATSTKFRGP